MGTKWEKKPQHLFVLEENVFGELVETKQRKHRDNFRRF